MSLAFIIQKYMSCSSNKSHGYEQNKLIGTWAWARPCLLHTKTIYYIHHALKDKGPTPSKTKGISIDGTNKTALHSSSMVFKTKQRCTKRLKKGKKTPTGCLLPGMPAAFLFFYPKNGQLSHRPTLLEANPSSPVNSPLTSLFFSLFYVSSPLEANLGHFSLFCSLFTARGRQPFLPFSSFLL